MDSSTQLFLTTVPAIRSWIPNDSVYTYLISASIKYNDVILKNIANTFSTDIKDCTGNIYNIVLENLTAQLVGDINLQYDVSLKMPAEGYNIKIGNSITISSNNIDGIFWGTRTILQIFKQSTTLYITGGTIDDYPTYPERSLMIDVGRKYYSPAWIKNKIKEMSYLKLNYLHLHLSDHQGFRLESITVNESLPSIKKTELLEIISLADQYNIKVVPEFDMPGHIGSWLPIQYRLKYDDGTDTGNLDFSNDIAIDFMKSVLDEFMGYFNSKYVHIGADEFNVDWSILTKIIEIFKIKIGSTNINGRDCFCYFVNQINAYVKSKEKILKIWGSGLRGGNIISFDKDIVIDVWDTSINPVEAINKGFKVMNCSFYPTYYVLGWEGFNRLQYEDYTMYEQWNPTTLFNETSNSSSLSSPIWTVLAKQYGGLLGGKLHVWSDFPDSQTEGDVSNGIYNKLRSLSQNTWGTDKLVSKFDNFLSIIKSVGDHPGSLLGNLPPYNFKGEITNPNSTITSAFYGNLVGDGSFGWQTKSTDINVKLNNFAFKLDNGNGNPFTYTGIISGIGSVKFDGSPSTITSTNELVPLILMGKSKNTYSGTSTLLKGSLYLQKPNGITCIPNNLIINNFGRELVKWFGSNQLSQTSDIIMNCTNGILDLNNNSEKIDDLQMVVGSKLNTGTSTNGILTVNTLSYGTTNFSIGTYTSISNPEFIIGNGKIVVLSQNSIHAQQKIKIMCIGDSITMLESSYRKPLYDMLIKKNSNIEMIGSFTDADGLKHEGRNGATIGPGEPKQWGDTATYKNNIFDNITSIMTLEPNIVLMLIGINDYANYQSADSFPIAYDANTKSIIKYKNLITKILSIDNAVKIYVASLLPVSNSKKSQYNVVPFNTALSALIVQTNNKNVVFVDLYTQSGINPNDVSQLYDGLHPTAIAGTKIANVWSKHLSI